VDAFILVGGEEVVPHELEGSERRWRMQQESWESLRKTLIFVRGISVLRSSLGLTDLVSRHKKNPYHSEEQ